MKPTYIERLNHFWNCAKDHPFSATEIALYTYLLSINNVCSWDESFKHNNRIITATLNISNASLNRAKNTLKQKGLIDFESKAGSSHVTYKLKTLESEKRGGITTRPAENIKVNTQDNKKLKIKERPNLKLIKNTESKTINSNIEFDQFWNIYGKKVGHVKVREKWKLLTNKDKEKILKHLPHYIKYTPNLRYRKNPITYLNQKTYEDDVTQYIEDASGNNQEPKDYVADSFNSFNQFFNKGG